MRDEGLIDTGCAVASGRAILRRILSLERDSWFRDGDMVWWLGVERGESGRELVNEKWTPRGRRRGPDNVSRQP